MFPGPLFRRELLTSSRRAWFFTNRAATAGFLLAVIAAGALVWDWWGWDRVSVAGMSRFTGVTFAFLVGIQVVTAMGVVPGEVGRIIPGERERKTLDALLATQLSSAEVVLGVMTAGLARYASGLAVGLPVMLLMVPFGGVDPRLVLLAYVGLAATGFAMAAVSVVASIGAPDAKRGVAGAAGLLVMWMIGPFMTVLLLPRFWPWGASWVTPVALVVLDSSPIAVLMNGLGPIRRGGFIEAVWRMIGYEVAGGVLLTVWSAAWLRPACRAAYDAESRAEARRRARQARRRPRPPCGDDPVLWKEMYTARVPTRAERVAGVLTLSLVIVPLTGAVVWSAVPAFRELLTYGYVATTADAPPEVTPFAWMFVRGFSGSPPAGAARAEFNAVIRQITALFGMVYVLVLAGLATEGVSTERARDTWSGLIATPLTGPEILRAKMLGAVWRARWMFVPLVGLWSLGLLSGAVHPLGFLAAVAGLSSSVWCLVALGTFSTLRSGAARPSNDWGIGLVTVLMFSGMLPLCLPSRSSSVLLGALSPPWLTYLSLVSYGDVRAAVRSGAFPQLAAAGVDTGEGAGSVLATCLIGLTAQAVAASLLTRGAFRGFDAAVGRPIRPRDPQRRTGGRVMRLNITGQRR